MYRRITLLAFAFVLFTLQVQAQKSQVWKRNRREFVGGLGVATFLGELGGANAVGSNGVKDFDFAMTRPAINLGLRYRMTERLAFKGALGYAILRGDDKETKETYRHERNLNFFSHIVELSGQFEFWFIKEKLTNHYKKGLSDISMYGFVGISGIWFNPYGKSEKTGDWVALQPLGTEGQGLVSTREKYNRFTYAIPYGVGMKYRIDRKWSVGLELGIRKTFTDYLDDVSTTYFDFEGYDVSQETIDFADPSLGEIPGQTAPNQQRGDPSDNDSYSFLLISVNYKLTSVFKEIPKFTRRSW